MSDAPVTLVTGPRGAYAAEALAAVLERQGRWQQAVWLRTSAWSRAAVASELAMACMHRWARPDVGEHIPQRAALHLAPLGSAVVVELGRRATPQVGRLLAAIRPTLVERASSLVVVGAGGTDRLVLPHDMLVAADALIGSASADETGVPRHVIDHLARVAASRPALVHDVTEAVGLWPQDMIVGAVSRRATWRGLLDELTATLVADATRDQRAALERCVTTGYCQAEVMTGTPLISALRPWVVGMEQGWGWLRPVWRGPLARHLRIRSPEADHPSDRPAPARPRCLARRDPRRVLAGRRHRRRTQPTAGRDQRTPTGCSCATTPGRAGCTRPCGSSSCACARYGRPSTPPRPPRPFVCETR